MRKALEIYNSQNSQYRGYMRGGNFTSKNGFYCRSIDTSQYIVSKGVIINADGVFGIVPIGITHLISYFRVFISHRSQSNWLLGRFASVGIDAQRTRPLDPGVWRHTLPRYLEGRANCGSLAAP